MIRKIYILTFIIGLISIFFGLIFKIMHWPGALIIMISGFSILGYIFAPVYFSVKIKNHENRLLKILNLISFFTLISLSTGTILKLIDIEIGYYLSLIGLISLTGFFIPTLTYVIVKNKNNRLKRIIALGASLVFLAGSIYMSRIFNKNPQIIDNFSLIENAQSDQMTQYQENSIDYDDLLKDHPEKDKLRKLKNKSDSISNYIHDLKTEIVQKCSHNDSLLSQILFEQGKATELKKKMEKYKAFIESDYLSYIDTNEIEKTLSLKISNPQISRSWEDEYFNHMPTVGVIAILTGFQTNVRYIEKLIFEEMK